MGYPDHGKEQETIYLKTHCGLEQLRDQLEKGKDLSPENKKLYATVVKLSAYFRYRWEEQKAQNSVDYWKAAAWQMLKETKKALVPRRSRRRNTKS